MALRNVLGNLALEATQLLVKAAVEAIRDRLPPSLQDGGLKARDGFSSGQVLNRQVADVDGVLTFTFAAPVDLVYVFSADHTNHMSSVDLFGGTPSDIAGIPVLPGVPQAFPVRTTTIKVYEWAGGEVTVWGYRY